MYLGPTTQSYRNVYFLQLAASFGEKKFLDADPIEFPKCKIARFGHVPGSQTMENRKIKEIMKM